jgi:hypothetical protein
VVKSASKPFWMARWAIATAVGFAASGLAVKDEGSALGDEVGAEVRADE